LRCLTPEAPPVGGGTYQLGRDQRIRKMVIDLIMRQLRAATENRGRPREK